MLTIPDLHNWRANLSKNALDDLNKVLTTRKLKAGEQLYASGDSANSGFQIISGKIKICNYSNDGHEFIIVMLHPADCFGNLGLVLGLERPHNAIASVDSVINILSRSNYEELCKKYPEIPMAVSKLLGYQVQILSNLAEDASLLPLYKRLAKVLVRLALSLDIKEEGIPILKNISHEQLGKMTGSSRQSIGHELKKLASQGYITLEYNKIIFPDLELMAKKFEQVISHNPIVAMYNSGDSQV